MKQRFSINRIQNAFPDSPEVVAEMLILFANTLEELQLSFHGDFDEDFKNRDVQIGFQWSRLIAISPKGGMPDAIGSPPPYSPKPIKTPAHRREPLTSQ